MKKTILALCLAFAAPGLQAAETEVIENYVTYSHYFSYWSRVKLLKNVMTNRCLKKGYTEVKFGKIEYYREKTMRGRYRIDLTAVCKK